MFKRGAVLLMLSVLAVVIYNVWVDIEVPETAAQLNNDLDEHAIAYSVIDGTPLILAEFGDRYFLDTIRVERVSMKIPPTPRWQWTGHWELVTALDAPATADLSAEFGPTVLFGLVWDDSIASVEVHREGAVVQQFTVDGRGYIVAADGVKLTDKVVFLDDEGTVIATRSLMSRE